MAITLMQLDIAASYGLDITFGAPSASFPKESATDIDYPVIVCDTVDDYNTLVATVTEQDSYDSNILAFGAVGINLALIRFYVPYTQQAPETFGFKYKMTLVSTKYPPVYFVKDSVGGFAFEPRTYFAGGRLVEYASSSQSANYYSLTGVTHAPERYQVYRYVSCGEDIRTSYQQVGLCIWVLVKETDEVYTLAADLKRNTQVQPVSRFIPAKMSVLSYDFVRKATLKPYDYTKGTHLINYSVVSPSMGEVKGQDFAEAGSVVNVVVTPKSGYEVKSIQVAYADEYDDTVMVPTTETDSGFQFTMPSVSEVFVRVEFTVTVIRYEIVTGVTPTGTASVNIVSLSPADLPVSGNVTNVSEGFSIVNIYAFYLGNDGGTVYLDVNRDGTSFSFTMPPATVNVRVITRSTTDNSKYSISASVTPPGTGYFTISGQNHKAGTSLTGDFVLLGGAGLASYQFSYTSLDGKVTQMNLTPIQIGTNYRFSFDMPQGDVSAVFITNGNPNSDTNAQGGTSVSGGGIGTINPETQIPIPLFDDLSYSIPLPGLPNRSPAASGLVLMYCPDNSDLLALADWLWSDFFEFGENFKKLLANPMDYIISLVMLPFEPDVAATKSQVKIGFLTPDNVRMKPVTNQWKSIFFGTITLAEYWGSALDYSPYTTVHLFLPFIGSVQLDTDEVMGHKLGLTYHVDCMSGACVAMLAVDDNVAYQYTGECGITIPLTGADFSRVYGAVLGAVGSIAAGFAVGGAMGAALGGANASLTNASTELGQALESNVGADVSAAGMAYDIARSRVDSARGAIAATGIRTLHNTVSQVMGNKVVVSHTGNISGAGGMLGNLVPYLTVKYPRQSLATDYKHFVGYPANLGGVLGEFTGFTQCESVIISSVSATDEEVAELDNLLKGGVYL